MWLGRLEIVPVIIIILGIAREIEMDMQQLFPGSGSFTPAINAGEQRYILLCSLHYTLQCIFVLK